MHCRIFYFMVMLLFMPSMIGSAAVIESDNCDDYSSWEWAQSIHDWKSNLQEGLDPDGNGVACEDLPTGGFAPAWWTDEIPKSAVEALVISVIDGDTLKVITENGEDQVRLYRADTPELAGCGGEEATEFVRDAISMSDEGLAVWLEADTTLRDRYDRRLAYVWFTIGGNPYMLNEVLIRSGWARDVDYGDRLYENQLTTAAAFAEKWQLGQYELCGGFDAENLAGSGATLEQIDQQGPGAGQCDPSYPTVCIPPIEVTGDLDCGQIAFRRFQVLPPDPHRFDGDGNGIGCERD
jgi:micrococcal nuclease